MRPCAWLEIAEVHWENSHATSFLWKLPRLADGLAALLLVGLQRSAVAGFLHRSDELVGVGLAFIDPHDGLVWIRDLRADHSLNLFECGPHSFRAVDRSGHSRNGEVHGSLF